MAWDLGCANNVKKMYGKAMLDSLSQLLSLICPRHRQSCRARTGLGTGAAGAGPPDAESRPQRG